MGLLDQLLGGATRESVAGTLGAPVDAAADAINGTTAALGTFLPQGFPPIENPIGGSAWMAQRMRDWHALSDSPGTGGDLAGGLLPMLIGPVKDGALKGARGLLEALARGERPRPIDIGNLTPDQLSALNAARAQNGLPDVGGDLWYRGAHHYQSRSADGYSIDDMLKQIESGLSPQSQVQVDRFGRPSLVNPSARADGYGNNVNDTVTFETSGKKNPELFSVIPKGDYKKPKDRK
ncbi:hypothetical protein [Burkholderia stagnalis]|uniref:hypothetical protein n=1 Tax=Burkholderia stagnalis TaxID=1503054 RepID=UPI000758CB29|nr:hypothetical protein [Burkholderia stagnalis]KVL90766.1 hypothetical protein WT02_23145 [Burkholderia stagnalis]KVL93734.1 hypothetical protein WT03_14910 [Burkholderia stagnalis]KVM02157.1 hypothetical protein WT04_30670 [Burkholderia stagnalis]